MTKNFSRVNEIWQMKKPIILLILILATSAFAGESFPEKGWTDRPNPIASPDAISGGEISVYLAQYPKSLNYYLDISTQSAQIFGSIYETLLTMNPITLEYEPGLAKRWAISDDKKIFTFFMDKKARWSDGRPITAYDVKWTYDNIMDPKKPHGDSQSRHGTV